MAGHAQVPPGPTATYGPDGKVNGSEIVPTSTLQRKFMVKMGLPLYSWERPASYKLREIVERKSKE
jgi:hypothetical protein